MPRLRHESGGLGVPREIADRRMVAAERAGWIAFERHGAKARRPRLVDQKPRRHALADTGDFLDDFQRLQRAHDAGSGAEHAGFRARARRTRWRRFGKKTAIAGTAVIVRLEGRQLTVKFGDRCEHQSPLGKVAGVVDQEARREVIEGMLEGGSGWEANQ